MQSNVHNLTGNSKVLQHVNTVRVMNYLRLRGSASRARLARATGLDAKTITNISNSQLAARLLVCDQSAGRDEVRRPGRPAERLSINAEAAFGVGIEVGAGNVTVVLVDLQGEVREKSHQEFSTGRSGKFLLGQIYDRTERLLESLSGKWRKRIDGIGIAVPGFIDKDQGIIRESVNIRGFRNMPMVADLQSRFGMNAVLEKSSRAMALAEIWCSGRDPSSDFICVDLGAGIGIGIVHNGLIYRGANDISGEIGHTVVEPNGIVCTCGKRGCLETVAGGKALANMAKELVTKKYGIKSKGIEAIQQAAEAGDAHAIQLLEKVGRYIGIAIANVINLFDPAGVVLNGRLVDVGPLFLDSLNETIRANSIGLFDRRCTIEISSLGRWAGALGAAMLPLRCYFEFENIRLFSESEKENSECQIN